MKTDKIIHGDCIEALDNLPEGSVHAVVTDPPYGLAFMGRSWDDFEPKEYQEFCEDWAAECKRVLKPGGHLLAFSGNRTHHRAFAGVEDAGFEIRDTVTWHYGSGFPKALDVSKAIDKQADAEREVVNTVEYDSAMGGDTYDAGTRSGEMTGTHEISAPATDAAEEWDGWKTGLKPATEYVVMARKPFDGATVDCVQEHGTGALNIGACRVGEDTDTTRANSGKIGDGNKYNEAPNPDMTAGSETGGRYFDETQAQALDENTDDTVSTGGVPSDGQKDDRHTWAANVQESTGGLGDSGGVSRYFYTSKASKSERTLDGKIDNSHPTVKPQDLMEWLIKLVTRKEQIVVDPFCGSGTTCMAAKKLNRQFIGIEKQDKWADVARVRCNLTPNDPSIVRDDRNQTGLESYQQ